MCMHTIPKPEKLRRACNRNRQPRQSNKIFLWSEKGTPPRRHISRRQRNVLYLRRPRAHDACRSGKGKRLRNRIHKRHRLGKGVLRLQQQRSALVCSDRAFQCSICPSRRCFCCAGHGSEKMKQAEFRAQRWGLIKERGNGCLISHKVSDTVYFQRTLRELPTSLTPSQLIYIIPGNRPAIASTQAANALSASIWLQHIFGISGRDWKFLSWIFKGTKRGGGIRERTIWAGAGLCL